MPGAIAALKRLAEVFQLRRAQIAREAGLGEAQLQVLEEIGARAFMPSLFARRRESSAAAVSKVLRTLLDTGLVEARIGEDDARRRRYALTERGAGLLRDVEASRKRAIDAVWKDLAPADLLRFARFSEELAERLEAYAQRSSEPAPGSGRRRASRGRRGRSR